MERIGLDQPTLKALAGETRVKILKMLDKKSMTQTDLAGVLKMSLPTVGEHLKALEHAELVAREETTRKWKYYSVTQKARMLLHPNATAIWFILGLFLFSAIGTVVFAIKFFTPVKFGGVASLKAAAPMAEAASLAAAPIAPPAPSPFWLLVFGAAMLVFLIALVAQLGKHGWLGKSLTNKKNI